ncbi:hypothetical protein FQR65_LT10675 [Abscondita terminalis]|nr:hypothetical protein FQR65_LT10675 [Abscondita terminalis]
MAFVVRFIKGVRNHWKKSTFAAFALAYGANYAKEYYDVQELMRVYCQEAAAYGNAPIGSNENPRRITIQKDTQKPRGGFTRTDAIVVAGGDGTLSEVITGLMRKSESNPLICLLFRSVAVRKTNTIVRFIKGVRNHWKKSTFAAFALAYGANYAKEYYDVQELMRVYCQEAAAYGNAPIGSNENPRRITVILNPNSNKRKAMKEYEKYCSPILHLAGVFVDVIQTDSEGHAKSLVEDLPGTDAIVVAGGDGTLSEVITGLMRKSESNSLNLPIGVLPLGKTNTIGKSFFPGGDYLQNVRRLADASLAIIKEHTKPIDVMKIEVLQDDELKGKTVYAVSSIEWGPYRDAQAKVDKYWYFGPLRKYVTYLFNGYKDSLSWSCKASLNYTLPCEGCKNCVAIPQIKETLRWYHKVLPLRQHKLPNPVPLIINDFCQETHRKDVSTSDFAIATTNTLQNVNTIPKLTVNLGPNSVDYFNFVTEGWRTEVGRERSVVEVIQAKQIEVVPNEEKKVQWFSIDSEEFEVKPVKITLLPKAALMFYLPNRLLNV